MDSYERIYKDTDRYKRAKEILKDKFGYDNFRDYQYRIINNILDCKDVLGIMPTGYGKSICFQIIPLLTNEVAIVISPLIALMADQKMILDNLQIKSCCYNSSLTLKEKREIEKGVVNGEYKLLYTTPETLVNSHDLIKEIYKKQGICMVAIDEAHCLSSYGFDFRPKYKEIVNIRELLNNVPILAMTATATEKVIEDIKNLMNMKKCETIITSFDRPNLSINVNTQNSDTIDKIIDIINDVNGSCIVYCLTRNDTEKIANILTEKKIKTLAYHSGLNKKERKEIQESFMNDEIKCIAATIAFGMGINKSNVRVVIHYGCPQNIESYYQEIGRAGRDGKESSCYLFYKQRDFIIQQKFINDIADLSYKNIRLGMLSKISSYVNIKTCRRAYILKYFGESGSDCGKCDNCCSKCVSPKYSNLDESKVYRVLSIITEIKSMKDHSYGASIIALILKGSGSQKIKSWMKDLSYYGSLKKESIKSISDFIKTLMDHNYIEDHDVGNCVHVIRCTDKGLLFGKSYEDKLVELSGNL